MANTMRSTDRNGLVPRHRSRHLCDAPDPRSWPENVCTVLNFIQQHRDHEGNSNKDSFSNWETEFCAQTSLPLEPAEYDLLIELLQLTDTDDVTDLKAKAQTQAQNVVEDFDVDALDDVPPETTVSSVPIPIAPTTARLLELDNENKHIQSDVLSTTSRALLRQDLASLGRHLHQHMRPLLYNPRLCTMTITRQPETSFHLCFKDSFGQLLAERSQRACSG